MRATGEDLTVARSAGIRVLPTRIIAIIIYIVRRPYGQIFFLKTMGTLNTYNSHSKWGFLPRPLLVGGASVSRALILNVFVGIILFHLMFFVSPMAGKMLFGDAQIGEDLRISIPLFYAKVQKKEL